MHEVGIITAVLDAVRESAAAEGITRVRTVRLVVGQRHGAVASALQFAFEVLSGSDDPEFGLFRSAKLEIEERPLRRRCRACGTEFGPPGGGAPGDAPGHRVAPGNGPTGRVAPGGGPTGRVAPGNGRGDAAAEFGPPTCPWCGSHLSEIVSGKELFLDYYEGD